MTLDWPNEHVREKHPNAGWLFRVPRHRFVPWENGEKRLYLYPMTGNRAGGVFTTLHGIVKTAFIAEAEYWFDVLKREGFR